MSRTYSRLLLVMSLFDLSTSIAQALGTWPMPVESGVVYAVGNEMTCNAQGFFTQLGVGAPMMNCSLTFYYLMVIGFPLISEARVLQIEWFLFGIPLTVAFSTAIMGLPLTLYNPSGLWCWISAVPGSCGNDRAGDGDCIRGDYAWIYRWAVYYAPVWFCVLTITFNMAIVTYLVWSMEWKDKKDKAEEVGTRKSITNSSGESDPEEHAKGEEEEEEGESVIPKPPAEQQDESHVASEVFWQAFYYVLAFYITWIAPTVLRMLQTIEKPVPYYVIMLMGILLPMQGFFNFLVYIRPRIVSYQRSNPGQSVWAATGQAIQRTMAMAGLQGAASGAKNHPDLKTAGRMRASELNDMQTLDPCYAMQCKRERAAARKSAKEAAAAAAQAQTQTQTPAEEETSINGRSTARLIAH